MLDVWFEFSKSIIIVVNRDYPSGQPIFCLLSQRSAIDSKLMLIINCTHLGLRNKRETLSQKYALKTEFTVCLQL